MTKFRSNVLGLVKTYLRSSLWHIFKILFLRDKFFLKVNDSYICYVPSNHKIIKKFLFYNCTVSNNIQIINLGSPIHCLIAALPILYFFQQVDSRYASIM